MTVGASDFDFIAQLVWQRSAIVLEKGKEYLVESRLLPLARREGEESVSSFVSKLQTSPSSPLLEQVVDAMTTNETSWFRDHYPFQALGSHILPEFTGNRTRDRVLRIWSAGCSSGQEPYSIAMVAQDHLALHPGWTVEITGTDISEAMLTKARAARYGQLEVNRGLPVAMLIRNFERQGAEWELRDSIRRMVKFANVNLAMPLPALPPYDVIFLRNVLIYFDAPTKAAVLDRVRRVLRPDGYLVLGSTETLVGCSTGWRRVQSGQSCWYRAA